MSESEQPKKAGATFLWVLGAFAGFAVLFSIIQSIAGSDSVVDPRAPERAAAREEITKSQEANLAALGFKDAAKKGETFNKVLSSLKAKAPAASAQVVPGSPTHLKQAAAAAPAPAPAATAPAPAK
ncbi:MAG: hypothetical protein HS117_09540 [Verrucomicrobiaceae bacterium]|nr:hypothetical protein [Verrucomicrobiaceae bacterium]